MEFIQTEFNFEQKNMKENTTEPIDQIDDVEEVQPESSDDIEEIDDIDVITPEVAESVDTSAIEIHGNEWINKNLVPIEKIHVYVPEALYNSIRKIESCVNKKFSSSNEFSIYIHGEFDEEGDIIVSEDYYIPKQKVGPASVDYQEEPDKYYNGCLHKHPDGCTQFSGTDKKYINSNFEFSLLYVSKDIKLGIVNIQYHKNRRIQVPVQIHIADENDESIDINNITKCEPKFVSPVATPLSPYTRQKKEHIETPGLLLPGFGDDKQGQIILPSVYHGKNEDIFEPESLDDYEDETFQEMFPGY